VFFFTKSLLRPKLSMSNALLKEPLRLEGELSLDGAPVRAAFRASERRTRLESLRPGCRGAIFFAARKDLKLAAAWVPDDLFAPGPLRLGDILIRLGDARLLCSNLGKRALNEHPTWMEEIAEREPAVWLPRPNRFTCQASERHPNRTRFPDGRAPVGLMSPDRRATSLRLWTAPEGSSVISSHGRRSNHDFLLRPSL
jgi:hypothetical protein